MNSISESIAGLSPPVSLLRRHRDFRRLWAGETVSIFGSRMGDVAVSFAAIIAIGATPAQMGVLASVRLIPKMLLSLIAGVWVDRLRRRPLMIGADLGRFALLATIPIAAMIGHLRMNLFYLVILSVSVLDLLFDLAYGAYLPSLIDSADLVEANSKLSASYAAAEVGGFALAGWLVQILTAPHAILVDAVSFIASALAINSIRRVERPITQGRNRRNFYREALEGVRVVINDRRLSVLALVNGLAAFSYAIFSTLYMLFVVRTLGFAPGVLGMIFAIGGVSSFFSSLVAPRFVARSSEGCALACGLALQGISWFCVPAARGATVAAATLLIVQQLFGDASGTVAIITGSTVLQILVPGQMLGRVKATISLISTATLIAGSLAAGWAAELVGLRPVIYVAAIGLTAAGGLLMLSPVRAVNANDAPIAAGDSIAADISLPQ